MWIFSRKRARQFALVRVTGALVLPNIFDLAAAALLGALFVALAYGAREMAAPLSQLAAAPVRLDPANLPGYALRTTLRMLVALMLSLAFTFAVATLAAKNRKAEMLIVPVLDILQSVPVLGFLTFTVSFFMGLFPGSELGAECASIFAIFTSQAWNMTFSFYQSLRTLPKDLDEVSRQLRLTPWQRFWRVEAPFAVPGLVWNAMMSMSGGWFFVVASEAITVGDTTVRLPGLGSWLALAIDRKDFVAITQAVGTMAIVIALYDQLMFRPIVAWADKFRFEQTAPAERPRSWVLDLMRRTHLLRRMFAPLARLWRRVRVMRLGAPSPAPRAIDPRLSRVLDALWLALVLGGTAAALGAITAFVRATLSWADAIEALVLGCVTMLRVVALIALASLIWVPIGVWIGLRPALAERVQPLAQFLAAFPANVLFPFAAVAIVRYDLDENIWLSPLMVLGTQWYILFNVIAGARAFPTELKEAASIYRLRSWHWWRRVMLPGIFPYYVTGVLTASGGSWNASIVAEVASWGNTKLQAIGLGAFIAKATEAGDFPRVVLGIAVMSLFVVLLNRALWRPLYTIAAQRLRLD